jgi:ketosteroid isomerase-like protein
VGAMRGSASIVNTFEPNLRRDEVTTDSVGEREIRELHAAWFEASHTKDLDASMAPIASDIVSYEHSGPLQYTEVDQIREECRRGFDSQAEDFMWMVPDLRVIARDDLTATG